MNEHQLPTMCIVHKGFRGFRAVSPALILGGNLLGKKPAIPYDTIHSTIYDVSFTTEKQIKIKIEIDKNPPLGFETDYKLLLLPFSFMVNCYTLPNLFAGKIHAFLFRKWNNRVKGRDWYDFEWYCRNQIPLNFKHLQNRTQQINKITTDDFSIEIFKSMMKERIESTDINLVKNDVKPFIKNQQPLDIWSQEYFIKLIDLIKIS